MIFFSFLSINSFAQKYNFDGIAEDLITNSIKKSSIAITTDSKSSGIGQDNKKAIEDAITNSIQRKAVSSGHQVIGANELSKLYDYKQFTGDKADFEEIASKSKADLLILINIQKTSNKTAQITGKLLGVSGAEQGKILNASKVYEIQINSIYRVFVEGVYDDGKKIDKLTDALISGLSNNPKITIAKDSSNKQLIDFVLRGEIVYEVLDVKTKESAGLDMMSSMIGQNMPQMQGLSESMGKMGKAKQVSVTSKIIGTSQDGTRVLAENSDSKSQPIDITTEQLKSIIFNSANLTLKNSAIDIGNKISGDYKKEDSKEKKKTSLLD